MLIVLAIKPIRVTGIFKIRWAWSYLMQILTFIWLKKKQVAPLPKGPFVVASNHQSYLDIVMMYAIIPRTFVFLGKMELTKWPLFGIFFRVVDIPVDRASRTAAVRSLRIAGKRIDKGQSIAIFPEATIPEDTPNLKNFKNGAFSLAIQKQVPVVPVTIVNHWKRFSDPGDTWGPASPGWSRVVVHAPIPTVGMTDKDLVPLRQQVYDLIQKTLEEHGNQ